MGRYTAHLVGESFYQKAVKRLRAGDAIELLHEPENPHDDRAVRAVTGSGTTVGYIQRGSWIGRVLIDEDTPIAARVHEIIGGGRGEMSGVVLEILTAFDAENPPDDPLPPRHDSSGFVPSSGSQTLMERAAMAALKSAENQSKHQKSSGCTVMLFAVFAPILASAFQLVSG